MTAFDLLKHIGSARDEYIMDARKRPKKGLSAARLTALAAAALLVLGLGAAALYLKPWATGPRTSERPLMNAPTPEPAAQPDSASPEVQASPNGEQTTKNPDAAPLGVTLLAQAEYPPSLATDDYDDQSKVWQENQVSEDTAYAMNAFSYKTAAAVLKDQETSGCYSPLSLYQTLAILASGSDGQTRDQLLSLLGQGDLETLQEESGKLYRVNYFDNDVNRLQISNSLWIDEEASDGTPISYKQDWVLSAAANYYADVYQADFSSEDTSKALGQWISDRTGGFLHPELTLSSQTVMAIVNTLWYKTQWANQFSQEETSEAAFTTESGEEVSCDFMHRTDDMGQAIETEEYTKSSLSLNKGRMIFVLPKEGVDVDSLLTEEKLWDIFENGDYSTAEVHWSVPKFETSADYQLVDTLKSLGVEAAFDLDSADFSLISDTPLYVGSVRQGTHIAINEDGVEAAAFSLAGMEAGMAEPEEVPVVEMNLNRPFLYLITADNGATLFLGVVRNPTE